MPTATTSTRHSWKRHRRRLARGGYFYAFPERCFFLHRGFGFGFADGREGRTRGGANAVTPRGFSSGTAAGGLDVVDRRRFAGIDRFGSPEKKKNRKREMRSGGKPKIFHHGCSMFRNSDAESVTPCAKTEIAAAAGGGGVLCTTGHTRGSGPVVAGRGCHSWSESARRKARSYLRQCYRRGGCYYLKSRLLRQREIPAERCRPPRPAAGPGGGDCGGSQAVCFSLPIDAGLVKERNCRCLAVSVVRLAIAVEACVSTARRSLAQGGSRDRDRDRDRRHERGARCPRSSSETPHEPIAESESYPAPSVLWRTSGSSSAVGGGASAGPQGRRDDRRNRRRCRRPSPRPLSALLLAMTPKSPNDRTAVQRRCPCSTVLGRTTGLWVFPSRRVFAVAPSCGSSPVSGSRSCSGSGPGCGCGCGCGCLPPPTSPQTFCRVCPSWSRLGCRDPGTVPLPGSAAVAAAAGGAWTPRPPLGGCG